MSSGIYYYTDSLKDDLIVYIGKDSHINRDKRHKDHLNPSKYDEQPFNRVLQNNPDRYEYHVLTSGDYTDPYLNALEIYFIFKFSPRFNYTLGGEGVRGFKHSDETKKRMSEAQKGEKSHNYGRTFSEETCKRISEAKKGKPHSHKSRLNMSKSSNTTGYYRVSKEWKPKYKQGFIWRYSYYDEDKKRHSLLSVDIDKLKEKVLAIGEIWQEFEVN